MVGKEDASSNSRAPCQASSNHRMFIRSASWSSSRAASQNPDAEAKDCGDPNGNVGNNNGQNRRFPVPLTPRSHQNFKARSCLPPLQPLAIARRSLDEWPKAGSDDIGEWPGPPTPSGRGSGDRLKLDLSSIQRNPDRNGGLVKRDKIAFFDKECSKVAEHIYLGGDAVARDRDILKQNGITHVLNCVGFVCPEYFKADLVYRTLWLQDSPSEDITSILYDVFDYFEDVREQDGRVFVHCCQGVSRSTSLVIAYLMWREGQSFDDAFQYVKAARGIADPNMGFACQLLQCQKRVHAFPLSPSSLLRMYRMAPHSPYDPLHLVPKMLNDPSPSALDSRGAFIVHIPSAVYIWIGKNCEAIMEKDARGAVCQIVRYERVQGSVRMIKEGEEPAHFWDAFKHLLPLMEKPGNGAEVGQSTVTIFPGDRKVVPYNVDFEIFQKAIRGGFVPPFASSENEHETQLPARESSWSVLRRKFASGDMKEFVTAPKLYLSRVYSDSRMIGHSSTKLSSPSSSLSSSSSSSSSASSPSHLSPNSISSDLSTNSKHLSESSLDSPSAASCSLLASSTLSNFSNLSLLSFKTSDGPEVVGVNFLSQPCSKSTSAQSKIYSPSLAERRGSLSKSLKLPLMADNSKVIYTPSCYLADQEDGVRINNTCPPCELDRIEDVLESKDIAQSGEGNLTQFWRNNPLANFLGSSVSNGIEESGSAPSKLMQPLVCRWPSLEKIATFGASDVNSKDAFAIFSPGLGKNENRILYFWVGRSFDYDVSRTRLESDRELDNSKELDWNQIGRDALTQMGLPKDTTIKIVKENEEPIEFLSFLSSL
ncbi:protein-tyrosine-phosphatase MKP1 [Juglans microcarpa x Juglans regia]|uniref:protein-tyrosine-phosphatase MKP1 n=1 Tax=Juglans microcarpa x Juglans regia TaxID=2249226 RepID=UPI001B7DFFF7|nr:protein-tyrosine-phosphatase MKP1 [Juglans microcarpa x Juglans regia]XP_041000404.1 protein-tyrosine-phosphatase MKP1 [Juglans microcarpa x Juglans regia]XP_041000405.1 protein-tyrosine-phosphatase MKP1 [Juglans microcarpa x Juglans regia]XP_041000406.1 protein-tyrosine-phosphatase MKP1 [Juglans microcarpa x Juglans regia]